MVSRYIATALILVMCSCGPRTSGGTVEPGIHAPTGLAVYPGATPLGEQRVYGADGSEITWEAFASPDPPADVLAFYTSVLAERESGPGTFEEREGGGIWRIPATAGALLLDIVPMGSPGPYQELEDQIPTGTKTIITLSILPGGAGT